MDSKLMYTKTNESIYFGQWSLQICCLKTKCIKRRQTLQFLDTLATKSVNTVRLSQIKQKGLAMGNKKLQVLLSTVKLKKKKVKG